MKIMVAPQRHGGVIVDNRAHLVARQRAWIHGDRQARPTRVSAVAWLKPTLGTA